MFWKELTCRDAAIITQFVQFSNRALPETSPVITRHPLRSRPYKADTEAGPWGTKSMMHPSRSDRMTSVEVAEESARTSFKVM